MNATDGISLVARVVGGLVIVLVLIAISARIARRSRHFGGGSDLEIVDRLGITKEAQLAVVRVAGRHLLIGIGPQGVSMLSHLDDASMAFESGAALEALAESVEPTVRDDVPPTVPPLSAAPVTLADVPADVAAELAAQFDAAQFEPARFETVQVEAVPDTTTPDEAHHAALKQAAELELALHEAARWEAAEAAAASGRPTRRSRRRHAAPEAEAVLPPEADLELQPADEVAIPEVKLPGALNLGDYPDLASALRAAGRTTDPTQQPAQASIQGPGSVEPAGTSSWVPSQRQHAQSTDLSHATSSAPVAPIAPAAGETVDPQDAEPGSDRRRGKARRVPQQRPQASGSVLSPATWRQGIEALREMTVRRG